MYSYMVALGLISIFNQWLTPTTLRPPPQQTNTTFPLPWAHQKTTSQHSACVLGGWPPLVPYTLLSHRMNMLSCHGRWLLCLDQNLNKLKKKIRSIKGIINTCAHLGCSDQTYLEKNTPNNWWSTFWLLTYFVCGKIKGRCALMPCLCGVPCQHLLKCLEGKCTPFSEVLAQSRIECLNEQKHSSGLVKNAGKDSCSDYRDE